ncbi:hypothetical protein ACFWAX_27660 [Streptomyces sp. NPDC059956]|uniref:AtuA-related protein n=1 Tax=Streptomyces sp. NPDC059956 TaxID=3347015 RepID=UPI0036580E7F
MGESPAGPTTPEPQAPGVPEREARATPDQAAPAAPTAPTHRVPLGTILGARSGDKGGDANVGVWAESGPAWEWLRATLTVEAFKALLPETAPLEVTRAELPNLRSLNFTITRILGDGVASGHRFDPQAKALGEWLRSRHADIPAALLQPPAAPSAALTPPAEPPGSSAPPAAPSAALAPPAAPPGSSAPPAEPPAAPTPPAATPGSSAPPAEPSAALPAPPAEPSTALRQASAEPPVPTPTPEGTP